MKIAYSLLLGEHVEAPEIVYGDCARYQITCPNCKEPVFKVERKSSQSNEQLDYFSHYEKERAYAAECELRVGRITGAQVEQARATSREQKLKYFLRVLKRAVIIEFRRDWGVADDVATPIEAEIRRAERTEALIEYRERFLKPMARQVLHVGEGGNAHVLLEYAQKEIKVRGEELAPSPFASETHSRIALDVWLHLLTEKARDAFNFLANLAFMRAGIESYSDSNNIGLYDSDAGQLLVLSFARIFRLKKRDGLRMIELLRTTKFDLIDANSTCLDYMNMLVTDMMMRIIIRLPYYEMLKAAQGTDEQNPFLKEPLAASSVAKGAQAATTVAVRPISWSGADITGSGRSGGLQRPVDPRRLIARVLNRYDL